MPPTQITYISYDRFPVPKGASVHIAAFTKALANRYGSIRLITLPEDTATSAEQEIAVPGNPQITHSGKIYHTAIAATGRNLIERVLSFRHRLQHELASQGKVPVIHVRSIFEGYPIAGDKQRYCDKLIYEVNGLPSVELKYHYPAIADDKELLCKLQHQENECLRAADLLVTVSPVNAGHLIERGADPTKIRVIPNGVDLNIFSHQRPSSWHDREVRALYSGTLASWQGVLHAIDAIRLYRRDHPARLTIVGEGRRRHREAVEKHCHKQGVAEFVTLLPAMPQQELADLHHQHDVVVAPLRPNDRNLNQGCCPLKVIEAMASGTPLIASDMPVTQSLAVPDEHAILVRPGSAKAIKDGMLRLLESPELGQHLSQAARSHVESSLTWQHSTDALLAAYERLID